MSISLAWAQTAVYASGGRISSGSIRRNDLPHERTPVDSPTRCFVAACNSFLSRMTPSTSNRTSTARTAPSKVARERAQATGLRLSRKLTTTPSNPERPHHPLRRRKTGVPLSPFLNDSKGLSVSEESRRARTDHHPTSRPHGSTSSFPQHHRQKSKSEDRQTRTQKKQQHLTVVGRGGVRGPHPAHFLESNVCATVTSEMARGGVSGRSVRGRAKRS